MLIVSLDLKYGVNIFVVVFGKMKVLKKALLRKSDFSLCGLKFDKYEGWICLSMILDAKHDIFTYLVLNLVNKKYLDDPCRVNEILVYMVANLINGKVELVPWFVTWFVNLFGCVFGKMEVLCSVNESIAMTPVVKCGFSLYGH